MKLLSLLLVVTIFGYIESGLYNKDGPVVELTEKNFKEKVLDGDTIWVVEFYANWCGHCKNFAPEYKKAAESLKGLYKVGAVDCDSEKGLAAKYGIKGFPTVKIFGRDKTKPIDYSGGRTAQEVLKKVQSFATKQMDELLGGGGSSNSKPNKEKSKDDKAAHYELTDDDFDETIQKSDKPWLVIFYAPWCGHCKNMMPDFEDAAVELKGKVNFGKVDSTAHSTLSSRYEVKGFPTLFFFSKNTGDFGQTNYDGGRSKDEIISWLQEKVGFTTETAELKQIIDKNVFDENCLNKKLCVLAFLPPVENPSDEKEIIRTTELLKQTIEKSTGSNWGWNWLLGGDNDDLEDALRISELQYPILVAIHPQKNVFATMRTAFVKEKLLEFIHQLKTGRAIIENLPTKLPTEFKDVKPLKLSGSHVEL